MFSACEKSGTQGLAELCHKETKRLEQSMEVLSAYGKSGARGFCWVRGMRGCVSFRVCWWGQGY